MEEYKEKFANNMEGMEMLAKFGMEDAFDMAGMTPGIDEMASLDKMMQYMNSNEYEIIVFDTCLLYTSPSPRDRTRSRMPSSA